MIKSENASVNFNNLNDVYKFIDYKNEFPQNDDVKIKYTIDDIYRDYNDKNITFIIFNIKTGKILLRIMNNEIECLDELAIPINYYDMYIC